MLKVYDTKNTHAHTHANTQVYNAAMLTADFSEWLHIK